MVVFITKGPKHPPDPVVKNGAHATPPKKQNYRVFTYDKKHSIWGKFTEPPGGDCTHARAARVCRTRVPHACAVLAGAPTPTGWAASARISSSAEKGREISLGWVGANEWKIMRMYRHTCASCRRIVCFPSHSRLTMQINPSISLQKKKSKREQKKKEQKKKKGRKTFTEPPGTFAAECRPAANITYSPLHAKPTYLRLVLV